MTVNSTPLPFTLTVPAWIGAVLDRGYHVELEKDDAGFIAHVYVPAGGVAAGMSTGIADDVQGAIEAAVAGLEAGQ